MPSVIARGILDSKLSHAGYLKVIHDAVSHDFEIRFARDNLFLVVAQAVSLLREKPPHAVPVFSWPDGVWGQAATNRMFACLPLLLLKRKAPHEEGLVGRGRCL